MAKNKISKRILFIVGAVLCCIFAIILACNLTIIIKGVVNPKVPSSVFGVTPMVVQSGSMSGNAEDHIEVGDLIFTVKPDKDKLKAGDIISYMDGNIAVTHRIIEVQTDADGKRSFVTKGDANNTEDPAVSEDTVFGLYKGRIPGLGDFAMFLHSKACPLSTISLWCFGRKSLQAKDLVECLNTKKLPEIFEDKTWFRSSIRWFKAAQGKFKDKFLMNRYLIDFITKQWKPDEDFEVFTAEMERKINDLTRDQADQIMNPHKTEGMAREQLIMDMLTQYLG